MQKKLNLLLPSMKIIISINLMSICHILNGDHNWNKARKNQKPKLLKLMTIKCISNLFFYHASLLGSSCTIENMMIMIMGCHSFSSKGTHGQMKLD
jgi:hypothetical protein